MCADRTRFKRFRSQDEAEKMIRSGSSRAFVSEPFGYEKRGHDSPGGRYGHALTVQYHVPIAIEIDICHAVDWLSTNTEAPLVRRADDG